MFGTDGIRGCFGEVPLTADKIFEIGQNLADCAKKFSGAVFIARDTRHSGDFILSQLASGIMSMGVDVVDGGIMPTPLTAMFGQKLTEQKLAIIIQITASHNPYHDNGIKFMWGDGEKWLSAEQAAFMDGFLPARDLSDNVGRVFKIKHSPEKLLYDCYKPGCLSGIRIVVDAAHGAYSYLAEPIFKYLGADISLIGAMPDGFNINRGVGSTSPQALREKVLKDQADVGIAFDGDGDRIVMVTSTGNVLDGDDILWILLNHHLSQGRSVPAVVITPMSNQGFIDQCEQHHIQTEQVPVGDHHILARLKERSLRFGAEPSGHVIDRHHGKTCDGLYIAVQVLLAQKDLRKGLDDLCLKNRYAQVQSKVTYDLSDKARIKQFIESTQWQSEGSRVSVRLSGTEPVVRIMVESSIAEKAKDVAAEISKRVEDFIA